MSRSLASLRFAAACACACLLAACDYGAVHHQPRPAAAAGNDATAPLSQAGRQRVLSGMLALIEAQHTFYVHIMRGGRFARNIRELGSGAEPGGTVMLREVWDADAEALRAPLEGWCFQVLPCANASGGQEGFAVAAFPAPGTEAAGVRPPVFLTSVPSAQGGLPAILSAPIWEVRDVPLAKKLRAALRAKTCLDAAVVAACAPSPENTTRLLHPLPPAS